jgi:hypothetical protein
MKLSTRMRETLSVARSFEKLGGPLLAKQLRRDTLRALRRRGLVWFTRTTSGHWRCIRTTKRGRDELARLTKET